MSLASLLVLLIRVFSISQRQRSRLSPRQSGTDIAIDGSGYMWLIGATNGSGNGNVYSMQVMNASYTGLLAYRGTLQQITSGGQGHWHDTCGHCVCLRDITESQRI